MLFAACYLMALFWGCQDVWLLVMHVDTEEHYGQNMIYRYGINVLS